MSQKLGLAKEGEIEKMLFLAKELENTDQWSRQLDERLVAMVDVISAMPEGKKILEDKRIDIKQWKDEATKIDGELADVYKKLIPLLAKK